MWLIVGGIALFLLGEVWFDGHGMVGLYVHWAK